MRRRQVPIVPFVVLALAGLFVQGAGPALAHEGHGSVYSEQQEFTVGSLAGVFDLSPAPVYAGDTVTMKVGIGDVAQQKPLSGLTVDAVVSGPGDRPARDPKRLAEEEGPAYVAEFAFPEPGEHRVTLVVRENEDGDPKFTDLSFTVYPAFPVRLVPANPTFEFEVGVPLLIGFYAVDAEQGRNVQAPDDLRVRIEQLDEGTGEALASHEVDTEWQNGAWAFEYGFAEPGRFAFRFSSESMGFAFDETPPATTTVHPGMAPNERIQRGTPGFGALPLLVGVAVAAAALTGVRANRAR